MKEDHRQTPIESTSLSEEDRGRSAESKIYRIRVVGHLDNRWSEWLDGLAIAHEEKGITVLTGPVTDQPALYGLLIKIRNLGLSLLCVQRLENGQDANDEGG